MITRAHPWRIGTGRQRVAPEAKPDYQNHDEGSNTILESVARSIPKPLDENTVRATQSVKRAATRCPAATNRNPGWRIEERGVFIKTLFGIRVLPNRKSAGGTDVLEDPVPLAGRRPRDYNAGEKRRSRLRGRFRHGVCRDYATRCVGFRRGFNEF